MLNWGKQKDIREVKRRVGDRMCLMGNVNPLEVGVRGTPAEVQAATLDVLEGAGGEGIILSVGGGISPGMPRAEHPRDAGRARGIQRAPAVAKWGGSISVLATLQKPKIDSDAIS